MAKQSGYKVTITGFLPANKKDIDQQYQAIKLLKEGSHADILGAMMNVKFETRPGTYDADGDGHATPVVLTGTAQSASAINVTLAARGRSNP